MVSKIEVDTIFNQSGDQDSGIDLSTNDVVAVKTANTERTRVDANGNLGLGNSSPTTMLHQIMRLKLLVCSADTMIQMKKIL